MKIAVVMLICALLAAPVLFSHFAGRAGATETEPSQRIETSSSTSASGDKRDTARWLRREGNEWSVAAEWSVETFNHFEKGEKKETQTLTLEPNGSLRRRVKRENIEGIETDCGQACKCKVWQTRTVFTEEDELYAWNPSTRKPERVAVQKWYITQPEESVFSICKKLNIPADRFPLLYHLNPQIQKLDKLPDATKLLIEKSPR